MLSEATLGGNNADICYGYYDTKEITDSDGGPGNPFPGNPDDEEELLRIVSGMDEWEFVYKDDGAVEEGSLIDGIRITIQEIDALGQSSGDWVIEWFDTNGASPANLPITLDLAVAFKAGNEIAYWVFEEEVLTFDSTMRSGTFNLQITPELSHASLFAKYPVGGPDPDPDPVPLPGTLALMGLGLLMLRGLRVRRR
jgi:hypothetical protein